MTVRGAALFAATLAACASSGEQASPPGRASSPPAATATPTPAASANPAPAAPAQPPPPSTAMTTPPPSAAAPVLAAATDSIQYAVGNPSFRGRTTVKVTGSGAVEVSFEHAGKTDRYTGQLDPGALRALRDTVTTHDPRTLQSARATGQPDETRIELTVSAGGGDAKVVLWDGEQWKLPPLRALVMAFNEIASKTTGGKVKY